MISSSVSDQATQTECSVAETLLLDDVAVLFETPPPLSEADRPRLTCSRCVE